MRLSASATDRHLALPKIGLLQRSAVSAVGELFLADISVPAVVHDRIGLRVADIFARDDVVALLTGTARARSAPGSPEAASANSTPVPPAHRR